MIAQIVMFGDDHDQPIAVPIARKQTKKPRAGNVKAKPHDLTGNEGIRTAGNVIGSPTNELCSAVLHMFNYFNRELFEPCTGKLLPDCVVIAHRSRKSSIGGTFRPAAWQNNDGSSVAHEIAINPALLVAKTLNDVAMIICHEMVHLMLCEFPELYGPNGTRGNHGKPFAAGMSAVGLVASKTGLPGGKQSGSQMWHYSEEGGAYEKSFKKLEATGFTMPWGLAPVVEAEKKTKSGKRSSYSCKHCETKASGKLGLVLMCGEHPDEPMIETPPATLEGEGSK